MSENETQNENPLGYEKISALLRRFAVPSVIAMLVSSLYNVVDQIFIGQGVGYLGNAATNVAFPLNTICMALTLMFSIGSATRFSLYLGQKREDEAAKVVGSAIIMEIIFGVAYAVFVELFAGKLLYAFGATDDVYAYALQYVRITALGMPFLLLQNGISKLIMADGSPTYSMVTMLAGAVLNTILDPIMIFVFHLGVRGAAVATVVGQVVSCIVAASYLRRFKRVDVKKSYYRFSLRQVGITAKMGMSQGLTHLAMTFVQVLSNRSLVHYGAASIYGASIPLAGAGIVMKVNSIIISIIIGINQGLQPIVGFNYGAKNYARVKSAFMLAMKIDLCLSFAALAVFQIFPRQVLAVFGSGDSLYYEFTVRYLRTFLCLMPMGAFQILSSNFFSSIGKAIKGTFLSLTRQVIFFIPALVALPLVFGFDGIMYAGPTTDFISFVVMTVFIAAEFRNMNALAAREKSAAASAPKAEG